jgi:hypothetical protein
VVMYSTVLRDTIRTATELAAIQQHLAKRT